MSKHKAWPKDFIYMPGHAPKVDPGIKKGSAVTWRRREFPTHSDGTTAGDRAGWIATYQAVVTKREKNFPELRITKQVSVEPGRVFDLDVGKNTTAIVWELELLK